MGIVLTHWTNIERDKSLLLSNLTLNHRGESQKKKKKKIYLMFLNPGYTKHIVWYVFMTVGGENIILVSFN